MRLWKMEMRRILGRPILNVGLCLLLAFLVFAFWVDASRSRAEIDGTVYRGINAIQADRKLAKEYEGILTIDKINQIVERFGFSNFIQQEGQDFPREREGNFCNKWVTNNLTDFYQTNKKGTTYLESERWEAYGKHYLESRRWEEYGKRYLEKKMKFGYTEGWKYFHSIWSWSVLALNVWLVLMTAPVFSEEYGRKTIHVLLTSVHGKWKDIWAKIAASLTVGIAIFLALTLLLFGMTIAIYGTDGLGASAGMFDFRALFGSTNLSVGHYTVLAFGAKFAAVCVNICVTLLFSSRCRSVISAVVVRMLLFYPLAWLMNEVLYQMLFDLIYDTGAIYHLWGWLSLDILSILCSSTTYYLSWSAPIGAPSNWGVVILFVLLIVIIGSIWQVFVNYRKGE